MAMLPDDWNGRFLMGGGGGYVGAVDNQFSATVNDGYATVGADAGHTGNSLTAGWALGNKRRIEDFAHRAVHHTAEITNALITITSPLSAASLTYPGQAFGDEAEADGWSAWIVGPSADIWQLTRRGAPTVQGAFGTEFFKYFVYGDSAWSYRGYDLARAAAS